MEINISLLMLLSLTTLFCILLKAWSSPPQVVNVDRTKLLRRSLLLLSEAQQDVTAADVTAAVAVVAVRPVMHTFFAPLAPRKEGETTAGMSSEAHDSMLRTWEDSWRDAGWQTRILTMDDAKQHQEFDRLDVLIQQFNMIEYDKMCYYRWLAMAAVGGGWMSDYDTLPLYNFTHHGIDLPYKGALTDYEMHVPSLVSGNANEWLRLTHRLVDYASKKSSVLESGETPSDMLSLQGLKKKYHDIFITQENVLDYANFPEGDQLTTPELCRTIIPRRLRAVHFSHFLMTKVWIPHHPGDTLDDRPAIARKWLEKWLNTCGRQPWNQ